MIAKKGDWIRIYKVFLDASMRAENLPEDTKKVPLEMWDKGFLLDDSASIGDEVNAESIIGRKISGLLTEINPKFDINYGETITETLYIGKQLKEILGE